MFWPTLGNTKHENGERIIATVCSRNRNGISFSQWRK